MADIALAIVGLTIAVIDDYQKTKKCLKLFAKSAKYIKTHLVDFEVQRAKFRTALKALLSKCVGYEHACLMMNDGEHPSWKDLEVLSLLLEQLSDSREAFRGLIDLIRDALEEVRMSLERFGGPDAERKTRVIRNGALLISNNSCIESSLQALRARTNDLTSLVRSITETGHRTTKVDIGWKCRQQVTRLQNVRETALDLYEALGHACTKHENHQAHLSLKPNYNDKAQVKFSIAFSQLSISCRTDANDPCRQSTWLTVESKLTGKIQSATNESEVQVCEINGKITGGEIQQSLKRAFGVADATAEQPRTPKKLIKKSVKFVNIDAIQKLDVVKVDSEPPLINLCTHSNFCNHLQKFIAESKPCSAAVGYLETSGSSKHLIYIDTKSQMIRTAKSSPTTLRSLQNILQLVSSDFNGTSMLSIPQKLQMARQLGLAVLQFHATPWLHKSWNSSEVLLDLPAEQTDLGSDSLLDDSEAFVSTRVRGPHGPIMRTATDPSPLIVRNLFLFRYGVMLLELAFGAPLNRMIIDRDRQTTDSANTEFIAADRLRRLVSAHMGPKYAEIVRRCIHCDFGCDFDLKESKLQEAFYQNVICELEVLGERMKQI